MQWLISIINIYNKSDRNIKRRSVNILEIPETIIGLTPICDATVDGVFEPIHFGSRKKVCILRTDSRILELCHRYLLTTG